MAALAQGLDEATEFPYLESRISQVELLEIFDRNTEFLFKNQLAVTLFS